MKAWIVMLVVVLAPGGAAAQETAKAWPGLTTAGLPTVYVLHDAGVETSGRLLRLDADSIVLLVEDVEVRLEASRVRRIQRRGDSLRNGALIGAVVGAGMGLIAASLAECALDLDVRDSCPGFRSSVVLGSIGIYAAIGASIDALAVGRTMMYDAQAAPSRVVGLTGTHRRSFALSLRW